MITPEMAASFCYEASYEVDPVHLLTESYLEQTRQFWPEHGRYILAQFDDEYIVVYQAFGKEIATYAVENQRFGGAAFSFERMSWIKTNFLWMMYRCGWASKKNQNRVLAIWIPRHAFENILSNAYSTSLQKTKKLENSDIEVRLQWDPDHSPTYEKCSRRAMQLGLKGQILKNYGTTWIHKIEDITPFVLKQKKILDHSGEKSLLVSSERVYVPSQPAICARLALDFYTDEKTVVNDKERHCTSDSENEQFTSS